MDKKLTRLPLHVGLIPDGNRRWAKERGLPAAEGYEAGIDPGVKLLAACSAAGIEEMSIYGFTMDNNKRPHEQRLAFSDACVRFAAAAMQQDVALKVVGDYTSAMFPRELLPLVHERCGAGKLKVNLLVNYGWNWDMETAVRQGSAADEKRPFIERIASRDVSRIDLVIRWGGMRRLSGFLPIQTVYSDFYVVDSYWPDYTPDHLADALRWYAKQDVTLGG